MTKQEASGFLRFRVDIAKLLRTEFSDAYSECMNMAIEALQEPEWIPFTFEHDAVTGEEFIDCPTPNEDAEILVSDGISVWKDVWEDYDGYGLESGEELYGLAWKPIPKPHKKEVK